jgi:hypothetical protein
MAVPSFLSGDFRYLSHAAVVDVADIITDLMTELVTNGDWTDEGAVGTGPFKSPVDAVDGSFMLKTLTRTSATRLQIATVDHNALSLDAGATYVDIDAGGTEIRYFTGPNHVAIESIRASPECHWAARLNYWPEEAGKVRASFVKGQGPRYGAGTSYLNWSYINVRDIGFGSYASNGNAVARRINGVATVLVTLTGAYMFLPFDICDYNQHIWHGRIPQCLLVDDQHAVGTEFTVPIDTGVTGVFKVSGLAALLDRKIAWRKA